MREANFECEVVKINNETLLLSTVSNVTFRGEKVQLFEVAYSRKLYITCDRRKKIKIVSFRGSNVRILTHEWLALEMRVG